MSSYSAFDNFVNPQNIDAICFDMDGVLADLYGVENWEEQLRAAIATPYMDADPIVDVNYVNDIINMFWMHFQIPTYIISWSSMRVGKANWFYDERVKNVKKTWVNKYLPTIPDDNIFVVPYGVSKSSVAADVAGNPVLIDDSADNIGEWNWANSVLIDSQYSKEIVNDTLTDFYNHLCNYFGKWDCKL